MVTTTSAPGPGPLALELGIRRRRHLGAALARAGHGQRGYWGALGQALSSLTNLVPAVLLARALGVREFSAFATVSATSALAIGFLRAIVSEPLLVRAATVRSGDRIVVRSAHASAIGLGLAVATACALFSLAINEDVLSSALLAYALVVTGVLVQDVSRYLLFASLRHRAACLNDLGWLVLTLTGFVVWAATGHPLSVPSGILIWGAAGATSAVVAMLQLGGVGWASPRMLVRINGHLGAHFAVQFFALAGAAQLALYLLGAVADLEAIGEVRATQLLFGPMNVIFLGAYVTLLPKGVGPDMDAFKSAMVRASGALSALAVLCTLALMAIPASVGEALLGNTWQGARPLIAPYGLYMLALTAATGPSVGLAALERARTLSLVRLSFVPATLLIPLLGASLWGSAGFVYGLAATGVLSAITFWMAFDRSLRVPREAAPVASSN